MHAPLQLSMLLLLLLLLLAVGVTNALRFELQWSSHQSHQHQTQQQQPLAQQQQVCEFDRLRATATVDLGVDALEQIDFANDVNIWLGVYHQHAPPNTKPLARKRWKALDFQPFEPGFGFGVESTAGSNGVVKSVGTWLWNGIALHRLALQWCCL